MSLYNPPRFAVGERDAITAFVREHDFAQIASVVDDQIETSWLPLELEDDGKWLRGHLARANPHVDHLEGERVQVTFPGPHGYVSPAWYESPGVPTWNYQVVVAYGICSTYSGEQLRNLVDRQVARQEQRAGSGWSADYDERLLQQIVGLEVRVEHWQAKFKLSQNRSAVERQKVAEELERRGYAALARAMRRES